MDKNEDMGKIIKGIIESINRRDDIYSSEIRQNITTEVIRDAMKAVSKDVRIPKCVRHGLIETKPPIVLSEEQKEMLKDIHELQSLHTGLNKCYTPLLYYMYDNYSILLDNKEMDEIIKKSIKVVDNLSKFAANNS